MKQHAHPISSPMGLLIVFILFVEVVAIYVLVHMLVLGLLYLVYHLFGFEMAVLFGLAVLIVKSKDLLP